MIMLVRLLIALCALFCSVVVAALSSALLMIFGVEREIALWISVFIFSGGTGWFLPEIIGRAMEWHNL